MNTPTNTCEIFDVMSKKWRKLPSLNLARMTASIIVCTNKNAYCFGGIESNPEDPTAFLPLKSIEWLRYDKPNAEWETLKIKVPFKASSSGAISMGDKCFIIFGGWNLNNFKKAAYIWHNDLHGFNIETMSELDKEDTFVSSGLTRRDPIKKISIIFGVNHCHVYDEMEEKFSSIPLQEESPEEEGE